VDESALWFNGLSALAKSKVRMVAVKDLKIHSACDFMPLHAAAQAVIDASVEENGILFPLALEPYRQIVLGVLVVFVRNTG
jgi:hypothetical protein